MTGTKTAMGTRTIPTLISTSSLGRPETDARWPNAAKRASAFHIGIPMMRAWTRIAKLFAAVILAMVSVAAGAPRAADDSTFGAKPWLLAPPPTKLTPLQKHRASVYRSNLQREIRRSELSRPHSNIRSINRLRTFRSELSRIERATRLRRRR